MPITKSAKKALRQSHRRRVFNSRRSRAMKDSIRKIEKLARLGSKEETMKNLPLAYKAIDKATKRGIIKKNTAARRKSRLARLSKPS